MRTLFLSGVSDSLTDSIVNGMQHQMSSVIPECSAQGHHLPACACDREMQLREQLHAKRRSLACYCVPVGSDAGTPCTASFRVSASASVSSLARLTRRALYLRQVGTQAEYCIDPHVESSCVALSAQPCRQQSDVHTRILRHF